ncbi:bifunctional diguanylate cyclase/phosphodiesterase [Pseudoalteromonas sp. SR45-4]|uniref:putative bifunctional diguanylate cyclase/phosphodiesterase n=1 Tax=Pseudoalteromonas sp. SR45-4 TaxID=2760929 RepID=UPI0015FB05EC|nr:bifunctional diguanylate cyclase/phosphodiesterase [Pseudoalteromonas sp. SR45-4]MBB1371868.1 bifunctional diguanylate cyclase/phosphodiesterase [Pseudoalteromonas sp. SR45-4]
MRLSLTQSAASILYLGFIQFFLVVAFLGALESVVVTQSLMPVISLQLSLTALGLAILLAFLPKVLPTKKIKYLIPILLITGAILFINFELSLWRHDSSSWFWDSHNPFISSFSAVMVFVFFLALIIKIKNPITTVKGSITAKVITFFAIFIGITLWQVTAVKTVTNVAVDAQNKIKFVETILNKNLESHITSLTRIKTRLEAVNADDFIKMANIDLKIYTQDFEIISSMLLLDENLNYINGTTYSKQFTNDGLIATSPITNWLKAAENKVRFAANSATLDTDTPIIMFSIPITASNGKKYQVLALLNLNLLIENRYIDYLSSFDTFIELTPKIYFAIDKNQKNVQDLNSLLNRYSKHYIVNEIVVREVIKHNVYSFIKDYSKLKEAAQIEQMIIWLTFAFIYILILATDSTFLLRQQSIVLHKMAKYDELTGLLRRDALNAEIEAKQVNCVDVNCAMVFFNLDGFSAVNNSLGHKLGDMVLQLVAKRLKKNAVGAGAISRFGNDEFVLHYCNISKQQLSDEITLVIKSLADIYNLGEVDIHLTVSVGIAMSDGEVISPALLLQQADIAMDNAKALGGNQFCFYHKLMDESHNSMVTIRSELQKAIKNEALEVYYQPIYNLTTQCIVAVEALVRWKNNGSYISPAVFIPIAEQTGQILQVGEQVLTQVLNDISTIAELQNICVAVNFSPQQIQQRNFTEKLYKLTSEKNIQPKLLTIEVTEMIMSEKGAIEEVLKTLMNKGFNVAIDDFGTGYSSLSYLSRQPANIIKIDREFTIGAELAGQKRALLEGIINICTQLNKTVVVEGVESPELIGYLSKFNNIRIQGFYYCKPMPLDKLIEYIHSNK